MALFLPRTLLNWCSQASLNRPTFGKSIAQTMGGNADSCSPIIQAHRFSVKGNESIRALVSSLLSCSCPTAVCRFVAFRAIDSVNAVRWRWFRPHVGVEVFKRLQPALAYYFSVSAVGCKAFMLWVIASLLHCQPRRVFWRVYHAMSSSSACKATSAVVPSKVVFQDRFFYSALASTQPACFSTTLHPTENCPLSVFLSRQVFEVVGTPFRITGSHDFVPLKQVVVRAARQSPLSGWSHFSTFAIGGQI